MLNIALDVLQIPSNTDWDFEMDHGLDPNQMHSSFSRTVQTMLNHHPLGSDYRCDHKCVHCYITERKPTNFLSVSGRIDRWRRALLHFVRRWWCFCASRRNEYHWGSQEGRGNVRICPHGNRDTRDADRLAEIGIAKVSISFYSDIAADHEAVAMMEGCHAKSVDACRMLVERGITVTWGRLGTTNKLC